MDAAKTAIARGDTALAIELGSTRIKAVLVGPDHTPLASGGHTWENRYEDGVWTYRLEDVWTGLQACYADLARSVRDRYGLTLETVGVLGISAMMHGYLPFDRQGRQLARFRTWRNTMTAEAAAELTRRFGFSVPQRWSVAHLYHDMCRGEAHVRDIDYMSTLSGYVHWKLTGEKVLGIGDASGMFPTDPATSDYDRTMAETFNAMAAEAGMPWTIEKILPRVLAAGQAAGTLTEEGARLLDPTGTLKPGIPLCPPEGDAATGMTATNAVSPRTGNISAGTSIFAMAVLEKPLSRLHEEIDIVATPDGSPVAMVQCNNGTPEMDAWIGLLGEFAQTMGMPLNKADLFPALYRKALEGEADCGGLVLFNYLSGEHIPHIASGRPLLVRTPESRLTLANFLRAHLFSTMATLRMGMEILWEEQVVIDTFLGHGGLFKTPLVGQRLMAAAMETPISTMETAGEGGPWGMALLASYRLRRTEGQSLPDYLQSQVFGAMPVHRVEPDSADMAGFRAYLDRYRAALAVERAAEAALG